MDFTAHRHEFEQHRRRRAGLVERWPTGGSLDPAVGRSVQRFQFGESGDGVSLIGKSARAGDPVYLDAVRLFVEEEQNHARLLAEVLRYADVPTIDHHWTDTVFVWLRRCMGLRLELMTLMLAEVVALRYYCALRDGTDDPVLTEVAGRILADEERHVPFHLDRLRQGFAGTSPGRRVTGAAIWWVLMVGATLVVAADHGRALRVLGVRRTGFVRDVLRLFAPMDRAVFGPLSAVELADTPQEPATAA